MGFLPSFIITLFVLCLLLLLVGVIAAIISSYGVMMWALSTALGVVFVMWLGIVFDIILRDL